jgi:hypothetical protein
MIIEASKRGKAKGERVKVKEWALRTKDIPHGSGSYPE